MPSIPWHTRLTLDHVWVLAAVVLVIAGPLIAPVSPNDLWFHVAIGQHILETGAIPASDSFSYTRYGMPYFDQPWLAQLLLFMLHSAGGVPLMVVFHALTLGIAYGMLLRLCVRRAGNLRLTIMLFLLALPVSSADWNIRPQTFAFPLFVGFLYVLTAYRLGWFDRLWLLPVLMALWVNMHGSFPLGLGLIAATLAGAVIERVLARRRAAERILPAVRPLLVWGMLAACATLLNPRGPAIFGYVRGLMGNVAVTQLVQEWAPPTIRTAGGIALFAFLIAGALILIYAPKKPDVVDLCMSLPLLWLALGAARNTVWFMVVVVPLVVCAAASYFPEARPARGVPAANAMLVGMLGLAVVLCAPWVKPLWLPGNQGQLLKNTPVAAVAWLRAQPELPRRLFHSEAHGSYLTFAAPELKVFIDPRIEVYPYGQWGDYITLSAGHELPALSMKYSFDGMLLSKQSQAPLIAVARGERAWQARYEDDMVVYFARR